MNKNFDKKYPYGCYFDKDRKQLSWFNRDYKYLETEEKEELSVGFWCRYNDSLREKKYFYDDGSVPTTSKSNFSSF